MGNLKTLNDIYQIYKPRQQLEFLDLPYVHFDGSPG